MSWSIAWRAAVLQALFVAALSIVLAAIAPEGFFEDYGWAAGPGAWAACALAVAAVLRLPAVHVLAGAAVAGLPSVASVAAGVHWAGAPLGVLLFGLWCGSLARRAPQPRPIEGT